MISNVIYSLPKAKFVPAPRHSSSTASSFIATVCRIRENGSRTLSRRASSLFFPFLLLLFFFFLRADTLEIDDRREPRGYSWRERDFLFSPLFATRCHFSRVPRFTIEDGRTESHTIPFPFEYNGVF